MGTRSITRILDETGKEFVTIYRQYDGYPSGMGNDIFVSLGKRKLVNGFSNPDVETNGMHCAAALLISDIKQGCGNVYLYAPGEIDCGEEYTYILQPSPGGMQIILSVYRGSVAVEDGFPVPRRKNKVLMWSGPVSSFGPETQKRAEERDC